MAALPGVVPDPRLQAISGRSFSTCEELSAALAQIFRVRHDEVALLRLQGKMLHFIFPVELRAAGAIPVSSSAVAARTATTRRAELFNSFVKVKHSSVFEMVKLGSQETQADPEVQVIQKLMSVPIVDAKGHIVGVIQLSRKGATLAAAGPDFTADDLQLLESAARLVGQQPAFLA